MKIEDVIFDPQSEYFISLSLQKLCGNRRIRDIECHVIREQGGAYVKLDAIYFEDGSHLYVEGEHDMPYVDTWGTVVLPDTNILRDLWNQQRQYREAKAVKKTEES